MVKTTCYDNRHCLCFMGAFALALAKYDLPVYFVGGIGGFIGVTIYAFFHNRMMAYVEDCIYGGKWDEYKGKENLIKNGIVLLS